MYHLFRQVVKVKIQLVRFIRIIRVDDFHEFFLFHLSNNLVYIKVYSLQMTRQSQDPLDLRDLKVLRVPQGFKVPLVLLAHLVPRAQKVHQGHQVLRDLLDLPVLQETPGPRERLDPAGYVVLQGPQEVQRLHP